MCGIAGVIASGRVDPRQLGRMASVLAHRGPDGEGVWIDPLAGIGLAHRRLAIIDRSRQGDQPMQSADGRFVISFNGEIYNHADLRPMLPKPDGGWRGRSDTETFLHAIASWGLERALAAAAGMFAFALWDRAGRTLHLVRDRFGEKPLYYGQAGSDFIFGSELKALRTHPDFDPEIDRSAVATLAARTYIPAPSSIYRRIAKLPPGCILTVEQGKEPRLGRYWSYARLVADGLANPFASEGEALEALDRVLNQAIRDQCVADVPVGAFLSGGIDSSTIVALLRHCTDRPVHSFTIGFEEERYNEARHAKAVACQLDTVHHERIVTAEEAKAVIPLLPTVYDEPFADSSQIPTFLVSRFAREQVGVALTGDGGDELFAGYRRHVLAPRLWALARLCPRWAASVARPLANGRVEKALAIAARARCFDDVASSFLDEWWSERNPVVGGAQPGRADFGGFADERVRITYGDATAYLPGDILCKVDRAAMAVGLETRLPFLDHRVAEVAARIPMSMKVHAGQGKRILRALLHRQAPRELFDRPKAGFAIPVGEWIKGPLRDWAEDLLDPKAMREAGWFDPAIVHGRWVEHLGGRRDSTPALWAVLMFEAWRRAA